MYHKLNAKGSQLMEVGRVRKRCMPLIPTQVIVHVRT